MDPVGYLKVTLPISTYFVSYTKNMGEIPKAVRAPRREEGLPHGVTIAIVIPAVLQLMSVPAIATG